MAREIGFVIFRVENPITPILLIGEPARLGGKSVSQSRHKHQKLSKQNYMRSVLRVVDSDEGRHQFPIKQLTRVGHECSRPNPPGLVHILKARIMLSKLETKSGRASCLCG